MNANIIKSLPITKDTKSIQLPKMDASEYQASKGILARLEIEWDRRRQIHVLSKKSYAKWSTYVKTDKLPKLNPTAFFPTPSDVIELMLREYFDESYVDYLKEYQPKSLRILEPSAGTGAIATAARSYFGKAVSTIDTVEYLPENCEALEAKGFKPFQGDFLDFSADDLYDIVLMNPPFSLIGDKFAYMTHVMHALTLLKPTGKLVAILPTGWLNQSNKRIDSFKELVAQHASWDHTHIIDAGAFKTSGTMVETLCICLEKSAPMNREKEHCGWETPAMWSFNLHSDALMTGCEKACELYDRAQNSTSLKQATEAYTAFFKFAKNELAKKAMFYSDSTVQRVIKHIVSYEFDDTSTIDTLSVNNDTTGNVFTYTNSEAATDEFKLTQYNFTDTLNKPKRLSRNGVNNNQNRPSRQTEPELKTSQMQTEFSF